MLPSCLLRSPTPLLALLALAACPLTAIAENTGVVSVDGGRFTLNGAPFYYAGLNNYYQMVFAADVGLRPYVEEVQSDAEALGLTVLRTWAFNDGASQWNALQTSPGVYQEYVFQGLDYALYLADQHGLRVILALVNNWDDYGGMNQYVAWSATANAHDDFYTDADCRTWYKAHVSTVLNRVNTFNGRVYREDPTIFAWELANEPECTSDPTGAKLLAWITEMSAYIKSIDPDHLVTTGSEGFYGPAGPNHNPYGWMSSKGVDFIPHHAVETIDFACMHAWPDWWSMNYAQSMAWVRNHIDDSTVLLNKPVILEEFGKQRPVAIRDQFFQGWYDEVYLGAQAGKAVGGSDLWILYHDDYPDYDGFGVYYPTDTSTCAIMATQAARLLVKPIVTAVHISNEALAHTDDYVKNGDSVKLTALVAKDDPAFGAANITADLSGLGRGSAVSPDSYNAGTDEAVWSAWTAICTPADGTVTVTVNATDGLGNVADPAIDTIIADNTKPTVVTNFNASPDHNECQLSWAMGTDIYLAGVTVRRATVAGDYPTYFSFKAAWPTHEAEALYPATYSAGTEVYNGTGTSAADADTARNIQYYQAFCYDEARNYGDAAVWPSVSSRDLATNYWLGDVAAGLGHWGRNGLVNVADINWLGAQYGTTGPWPDYFSRCDVGPTVHPNDHRLGVPKPDDAIQFEDLMVFAMNYGVVAPRIVPFLSEPGDEALALTLTELMRTPEGELHVALRLEGNVGEVKGLSAVITFGPSELEFVSARLSDGMASPIAETFFWSGTEEGKVLVDLAVLGTGVTIGGSGEVAVLMFRALGTEYALGFEEALLRGAENEELTAELEGLESRPEVPTAFRLVQNVPNPFNPRTVVVYEVPQQSAVTIRVYDVTGRLVTTLVDGVVEPGRYAVEWDGTSGKGEPVGGSVYFCVMETPEYRATRKMVLMSACAAHNRG